VGLFCPKSFERGSYIRYWQRMEICRPLAGQADVRIYHPPSIFLVSSLHNSCSHFSANALRASGGRGRIRLPRTTYWLPEFNRSGILRSAGVMSVVVDMALTGMDVVLTAIWQAVDRSLSAVERATSLTGPGVGLAGYGTALCQLDIWPLGCWSTIQILAATLVLMPD